MHTLYMLGLAGVFAATTAGADPRPAPASLSLPSSATVITWDDKRLAASGLEWIGDSIQFRDYFGKGRYRLHVNEVRTLQKHDLFSVKPALWGALLGGVLLSAVAATQVDLNSQDVIVIPLGFALGGTVAGCLTGLLAQQFGRNIDVRPYHSRPDSPSARRPFLDRYPNFLSLGISIDPGLGRVSHRLRGTTGDYPPGFDLEQEGDAYASMIRWEAGVFFNDHCKTSLVLTALRGEPNQGRGFSYEPFHFGINPEFTGYLGRQEGLFAGVSGGYSYLREKISLISTGETLYRKSRDGYNAAGRIGYALNPIPPLHLLMGFNQQYAWIGKRSYLRAGNGFLGINYQFANMFRSSHL